jgi:outer membrane protein OmpA-like peptidoglycan-associated protein
MNKRTISIIFGLMVLLQAGLIFAQKDPGDVEGSKDPSIFTRMKGFHITIYEELEFNKFDFPVAENGKVESVEGHHYNLQYELNEGAKAPSALQITRNYTNAAKTAGGKLVYQYEDGGSQSAIIKITKGKAEIWAKVYAWNNGTYTLNVIEKQAMEQVVVADASSLASSLNETGKVSVYGILFDTDKATIKPESKPALDEIAKMIKANSNMKLYVVGHTDNTGAFDHNVKLSKDRADSVVKELTGKYSISASLLKAFGAGPTAPVASNEKEEGRAQNRRVELVQQ